MYADHDVVEYLIDEDNSIEIGADSESLDEPVPDEDEDEDDEESESEWMPSRGRRG